MGAIVACRPCVRHATAGQFLSRMGQSKPTYADAYQGVPRPVGAMAHDLPPAHEIPWHSHPRFQLIYAVRGVMTDRHARRDLGGAAAARGVDAAEDSAPRAHLDRGAHAHALHPAGAR